MIDGINPIKANSFLAEMQKPASLDAASAATDAQSVGASFSDFMNNLGTTFVDNLKDAEKKSTDGILGKASVREVVESVMTADQTLQTAMAFRDKIVSAYLEVVKMPI